jgi:hypothetical protein
MKYSPLDDLYLAIVLLYDWPTYAITNSWTSLSSWVSTIPNWLICNYKGCPHMGSCKMGIDVNMAFNSLNVCSYVAPHMYDWSSIESKV